MATIAELDVVLGLKNQRSFTRDLTVATAAVTAAGVAFDRLLDRGGKIAPVQRALTQLTKGQRGAVDQLRNATQGLVSDYQLMQQANTALTLGSARNIDDFATLASTAQRLGRALGVDTQTALNSLNSGIARQSRLLLDNIGLIVDAESANRKYAAQLGITVDQLDDAQRKEAFRVEAMEQARAKVAELGDEVRNNADAWSSLKTEIGNTADALATGAAGGGGLVGIFDRLTEALRAARTGSAGVLDIIEQVGLAYAGVPTSVAPTLGGDAAAGLEEMATTADVAAVASDGLAQEIEFLQGLIHDVNLEINPLTGGLLDFGDASHMVGTRFIPELDEAIKQSTYAADVFRDAIAGMNAELSNTQKASRGAALGLSGLSSLGQIFGFAIPGISQLFGAVGLLRSATGLGEVFGGARASGGPVNAGMAYMVGEAGPEMFLPNQSGTIVPSGGITINVPPARDLITMARDVQWQRAILATFEALEGNGFRATA